MPIHDFKSQRLYLDSPLNADDRIELERNQANYLISVLRMKSGESILAFNGRDGEWRAEIEVTGRKSGILHLAGQTRPQPARNDLVMAFAPLKQARFDYMVQKATEMGAGVLQPVITQHTQAQRINPERFRANAIEAAEQCGILTVPHCMEPQSLSAMIEAWNSDRVLVLADEAAEEHNPLTALASCRGKPLGILVGPEGGFSEKERSMLLGMPQTLAISLGPRILRADTAAVAALAVVQAACGDW